MQRHNKVVRIFVSSTFEDMKAERNYLQAGAFSRLREDCKSAGWQFQAVDLRWGISEEASIDQKTMEICLREIERCQQQSPRPNFLVLLGERYGWRPLPDNILKSVEEQMRPDLPPDLAQRFKEWYALDENQLPEPVWRLKARQGRYWDYKTYEKEVQIPLSEFFTEWSAQHLPDPDLPENRDNPLALQCLKMERSATEQEIQAGAFRVEDAAEHVFAFLLSLPEAAKGESAFHDADQTAVIKLRDRLQSSLPAANKMGIQVGWDRREKHPTPGHLQDIDEKVYEFVKGVIDREIEKFENLDQDALENEAHLLFARERTFGFSGREKDIEAILDYAASDSKAPLVLTGASGTGKSSLLAMASMRAAEKQAQAQVLARYIGVTGKASNGSSLLRDICRALCATYGSEINEVPEEPSLLEAKFRGYLALATAEKPLVLFLDALDQLSEYDPCRKLHWLPRVLPDNVKIVLSTLDVDCLQILKSRIEPECVLREILPLTVDDGRYALDAWLKRANRTLQDHQREQIIRDFATAGCEPLYLHLAYDRARQWESYSPRQRLGRDIPEMIEDIYTELSRPEAHGPIVEKALTAIRSAKQGLSDDEILGILAADDEFWSNHQAQNYHASGEKNCPDRSARRIPPVYWIRLYHELEYYLCHRTVYGTDVINFYHRQLAEAVDSMYLQSRLVKTQKHQSLAEFFACKSWLIKEDAPMEANKRKCDELPWQRIQSEDWDAVVDTLCDLDFIQAKAVAKMTYELVEDLNTALKLIPDNAEIAWQEREFQSRMEKYTQDLIACAKGEVKTKYLDIPKSITPWKEGEMEREILRIKTNPNRADKLNGIKNFLGHEAYNLQAYAQTIPGFTYQQAWNYASDGIIGVSIEKIPYSKEAYYLLLAMHSRHKYNLLPQELTNLVGHSQSITAVSMTPDGKIAISGSRDKTCIVWNVKLGSVITSLRGHTDGVLSVCITPDGMRAISGSLDKTIIVWDLESGRSMHILRGHKEHVNSVYITPDGSRAISGSWDGKCIVWDIDKEKPISVLNEHKKNVTCVCMTPDCKWALSGSKDQTCILWNLENGAFHRLYGHDGDVSSVSITPDGKTAVSGSWDKTFVLWNLVSKKPISRYSTGKAWVSSICITSDGQMAICGLRDNTCQCWDVKSGNVIKILIGHKNWVTSVCVSPDGRTAITGSMDKTIIAWDVLRGKSKQKPIGHTDKVFSVDVSTDLDKGCSGSRDGSIIHWDLKTLDILWNYPSISEMVLCVSYLPDGKRVVCGTGNSKCIVFKNKRSAPVSLFGHNGGVTSISVSPSGRTMVSGSVDKTCILWDIETEQAIHYLDNHNDQVNAVCFLPDGQFAVSCSYDKTCILWDLARGRKYRTLKVHSDPISCVDISPDGRYAVSVSWDLTCWVWDLSSGVTVSIMSSRVGSIIYCRFTRDGKGVLCSTWDKNLFVWDWRANMIIAQLPTEYRINSIGFTKEGIIVGDSSGDIAIYNAPRSLLDSGTPYITSRQIWDFDQHKYLPISADCPLCGDRFAPDKAVVDTISRITEVAGLSPEQSPCLYLPDEAWEDPGLFSNCPKCGEALKFNPFFPALR